MSVRITTPALARSVEIAEAAASAVLNGDMKTERGRAAIYGARAMQAAVKTEVEARLTRLRVAAAIRAVMWRGESWGRSNAARQEVLGNDAAFLVDKPSGNRAEGRPLESGAHSLAESMGNAPAVTVPDPPG